MYYSREELERIRREGKKKAEELVIDENSKQKYKAANGNKSFNTRGLTFFGLD